MFEVLESLAVAAIPDFWNDLGSFSRTFSILIVSRCRCGDQNCYARTDKIFVEWQHYFSIIVLEIAGNESECSIFGVAALLRLLLTLEAKFTV